MPNREAAKAHKWFEDTANEIDAHLKDTSVQETDHPESQYLGLQLDEGRRTVGREGVEVVVDMGNSPLWWALLVKFCSRRGRYTSVDQLRSVWEEHGRESSPEIGTVRDTISHLRKRLSPLRVLIANSREIGYRLEDEGDTKS